MLPSYGPCLVVRDGVHDWQCPAGQVPAVPGEVALDRAGKAAFLDRNDPRIPGGIRAGLPESPGRRAGRPNA